MSIPCDIVSFCRFTQPWWLVGVVAAALPIVWARTAKQRGVEHSRVAIFLQSLCIITLATALARPVWQTAESQNAPWLILQDVSASVGEQANSSPTLQQPSETQRFANRLLTESQSPSSPQTALRQPLQLATTKLQNSAEPLAGVILHSDGQWQDHWPLAARQLTDALTQTKTPLLIVPMDRPPRDARVSLQAQRITNSAARPIDEVTITSQANAIVTRTITLRRDTTPASPPLLRKTIKFLPHQPVTFRLNAAVTSNAPARYIAQLQPADKLPQNDIHTATAWRDTQRIGWVTTDKTRSMLPPAKLVHNTRLPLDVLPASDDVTAYLPYAALVLVSPKGNDLTARQRLAVADYVKRGGGLLLLGTGPGETPADQNDPLNQVAALVPNPFQRRPLMVTVVLDASGSMAEMQPTGQRRFDLAAEATISLRQHLTKKDRLRVVQFSDDAKLLYDSGQSPVNFAKLQTALQTVEPTGATKIASAWPIAIKRPTGEHRDGLILVLSDLQTQPFDVTAVAGQITANKQKLAVVAIGNPGEQPTSLQQLCDKLTAPLALRKQLRGVASVFGQLCRRNRGDGVTRGKLTIQAREPWKRLALPIPAALRQTAKPDPSIWLAKAGGEFLLAQKRSGLGECFTLPLVIDNPSELSPLTPAIRQILARCKRPLHDPRYHLNLSADTLIVTARETSGRPMNLLHLVAEWIPPNQSAPKTAPLTQFAPGRYRLNWPKPLPTGTTVRVYLQTKEKARRPIGSTVVTQTTPEEYIRLGANYRALRQLAEITGGKVVSADELADQLQTRSLQASKPLWPWVLAASLAMMLLQWIAGRVTHKS